MAELTDPVLFATQAVRLANTPHERARAYRTLADLYEANLIDHATAQRLMDALDRRAQLADTLGMDEHAGVN